MHQAPCYLLGEAFLACRLRRSSLPSKGRSCETPRGSGNASGSGGSHGRGRGVPTPRQVRWRLRVSFPSPAISTTF